MSTSAPRPTKQRADTLANRAGNALFASPAYQSESLYRPLILFGGFAAFAALGREAATRLFRAGVATLAVLVLLGLLQHFTGGHWQVIVLQQPG